MTPIASGFNWLAESQGSSYANDNTFSAGLDTNGLADVFIKWVHGDGSTNLYKWTTSVPTGVTFISVPGFGYNDQISATTGGMCFFTVLFPGASHNTIGQYDPRFGVSYWPTQQYSQTNVAQLSAAGANDVFAIGADGNVVEFGFAVAGGHQSYGDPVWQQPF